MTEFRLVRGVASVLMKIVPVIVVTLGLAQPGHAATVVAREPLAPEADGALVLSGRGAVTWVTGRPRDGLRVRTRSPETRARTVARLPRAFSPYVTVPSATVALDGRADGRVAVNLSAQLYEPVEGGRYQGAGRVLLVGPAGGPLRRVAGCLLGEPDCNAGTCFDVGQAALVPLGTLELIYGEPPNPCRGGSEFASLVRRDQDGRVLYDIAVASIEVPLVAAGRYAAYAALTGSGRNCLTNSIVVRNVRTGAIVDVTAGPSPDLCDPDRYAISETGALITLRGRALYRRSTFGAAPKRLPVRAAVGSPLAVTRDQIAFVAADRDGPDRELTVIGGAGNTRVIARFNKHWRRTGDIDFNGRRVAWSERRCGEPHLMSAKLDNPRADPPGRLSRCTPARRNLRRGVRRPSAGIRPAGTRSARRTHLPTPPASPRAWRCGVRPPAFGSRRFSTASQSCVNAPSTPMRSVPLTLSRVSSSWPVK